MTPNQGVLIGSRTCKCGAPLPEYPGVGRPRSLCEACYPTRAPARKQHEVPAGVSVEPRARLTDPDTSHEAARVASISADNNRGLALLALADAGAHGLNDFELAEVTGKAQTSIGVRRKELRSAGLVERAPIHPRPSPSGTPSIVWRCTDAGYVKARELRGTA